MNQHDPLTLKIAKCHPRARMPVFASAGASGADIFAVLEEPILLAPGQRTLVPTGLLIELPIGYEAQIRPRSGLALHYGITILNTPGTIDSDYRGEICILLINFGDINYTINDGDRIAQMVINPLLRLNIIETASIAATARGEGGFGSSGR